MNIEKFTERSRGFLQAAQTIATREYHQRLTPEHLVKALLDDEEGAAAGLLRAAGADPKAAQTAIDAEVARIPRVQGSGAGQPQATPELIRALDVAERDAAKAGDEFVAQDRLLLALAAAEGPGARALRQAGVTLQSLEKAIADIRKGRKVTSANAEANFDALKKYARDLTEIARRRQTGPGDRPRRGDPPDHPGARAPHQEQSGADRRARGGQDRDRRRPGAAHRQWRRAGIPARTSG